MEDGNMLAPELMETVMNQLKKFLFTQRFGTKELSGFKSIFPQCTLTKSVYGKHGSFIQHKLCICQPSADGLSIMNRFGSLYQCGDGRIFYGLSPTYFGCESHKSTHTQFQFCNGSPGEGHHQDLLDGDIFFHNQPEYKQGNGIGFAGACAGFNQVASFEAYGSWIKRLWGLFHGLFAFVENGG